MTAQMRDRYINNAVADELVGEFENDLLLERNQVVVKGTNRFGQDVMRKLAWWEAYRDRHGSDNEGFEKAFMEAFKTDESDKNRIAYRFLNWRMFPPLNLHEMCIELPPFPESCRRDGSN